jgi:hypothetical protein
MVAWEGSSGLPTMSRRWSGDGGRAAAKGRALRRRQGRAEQSTCSGKKKRGGSPGDLFGIFKDFWDLSVKKDFPPI